LDRPAFCGHRDGWRKEWSTSFLIVEAPDFGIEPLMVSDIEQNDDQAGDGHLVVDRQLRVCGRRARLRRFRWRSSFRRPHERHLNLADLPPRAAAATGFLSRRRQDDLIAATVGAPLDLVTDMPAVKKVLTAEVGEVDGRPKASSPSSRGVG
jgi:hypothetical protein